MGINWNFYFFIIFWLIFLCFLFRILLRQKTSNPPLPTFFSDIFYVKIMLKLSWFQWYSFQNLKHCFEPNDFRNSQKPGGQAKKFRKKCADFGKKSLKISRNSKCWLAGILNLKKKLRIFGLKSLKIANFMPISCLFHA